MKASQMIAVAAALQCGIALATELALTVTSSGSDEVSVNGGDAVRYTVSGVLSDTNNEGLARILFDIAFTGGPLSPADAPDSEPMLNFAYPAGLTNPDGFGGTVANGTLVQVGGAQNTINNPGTVVPFPNGTVITGVAHTETVLATATLIAPVAPGSYTLSISNLSASVIRKGEDGAVFWSTDRIDAHAIGHLTVIVEPPSVLPPAPEGVTTCVTDVDCVNLGRCVASTCYPPKNRYLSLDTSTNASSLVAYRVALASMKRCSGDLRRACIVDADCPMVCDNNNDLQCADDAVCDGGSCVVTSPCIEHSDAGAVAKWLDEPFISACVPLDDCVGETFANLRDTPLYRVWTESVLHITDCEIVPAANYDVQSTTDNVSFSETLLIGTIEKPQVQYADCVGPVVGKFTPPDGFTNVVDVQGYLIANQGGDSAPHTTWVDLHSSSSPVVPQQILNIGDLQTIKFGFLGQTYAETPGHEDPGDCP